VEPLLIAGAKGTLELREDGVIHLIWQPKARLEVSDVRAAIAKVNDLCGALTRPMLVDMAGTETVSHDARAAFSTPCGASRIALLGANPVDRIIANFRGAHTYPCPTRFFTDRTEALNWLLQDPLPPS
jgi:hypothetical protein